MIRIEQDDVSRTQVLSLLEEHLRNMYELSPPDKVFAFDPLKLRAPGITFWSAWQDDMLLGCAALKELSRTDGEIKSMRTPAVRRRTGARQGAVEPHHRRGARPGIPSALSRNGVSSGILTRPDFVPQRWVRHLRAIRGIP